MHTLNVGDRVGVLMGSYMPPRCNPFTRLHIGRIVKTSPDYLRRATKVLVVFEHEPCNYCLWFRVDEVVLLPERCYDSSI
jgi:hypothetical protein